MDANLIMDSKLQDLEERAIGRLLTAEVFNTSAWTELVSHLNSVAERLQSECAVPKQYLNAILQAVSAIRSRAEYIPEIRPHLQLADELEMLLGLVARSESAQARRPGVPRVI